MESQQFSMTDSLSAGLTSRFFAESDESKARILLQLGHRKASDKKWPKALGELKAILQGSVLSSYEGGSNRQPYYMADILHTMGDRKYNTWNEKCLTAVTCFLSSDPRLLEWLPSCYSISEHAIRRLFLRTKPTSKAGGIQVKSILVELELLPFWANYWTCVFFDSSRKALYDKCHPIIPTRSGLLLGEYNSALKTVEIRTFVDDDRLTADQLQAKTTLISLMEGLNPSPLCFSMAASYFAVDYSRYLGKCLNYRLVRDGGFRALKNVIFHKLNDDRVRAESKAEFEAILVESSDDGGKILDDELRKVGVKKFLIAIRQIQLQAGGFSRSGSYS